jgi:hypothetical protein
MEQLPDRAAGDQTPRPIERIANLDVGIDTERLVHRRAKKGTA